MSSKYGYDVYIDGLILPITPGEITSKFGSTNEVITLINEGEINILKSPSLTEISFEARFPMRNYPYSREPLDFQAYYKHFNDLKSNKKPFRFIVSRQTLKGVPTWYTNLEMALEEFEVKESADEGDDVIISFELKQYKNYGVKTLRTNIPNNPNSNVSVSDNPRPEPEPQSPPIKQNAKYMTQQEDTWWSIAQAAYGDGSKWNIIYEANKDKFSSPRDSNIAGVAIIVPNMDREYLEIQHNTYDTIPNTPSASKNPNGYVSVADLVREQNETKSSNSWTNSDALVEKNAHRYGGLITPVNTTSTEKEKNAHRYGGMRSSLMG